MRPRISLLWLLCESLIKSKLYDQDIELKSYSVNGMIIVSPWDVETRFSNISYPFYLGEELSPESPPLCGYKIPPWEADDLGLSYVDLEILGSIEAFDDLLSFIYF